MRFILILLLFIFSCKEKVTNKPIITETIIIYDSNTFNIEKDIMINKELDNLQTKKIETIGNSSYYELTCLNIRLKVYHIKSVPFESKEYWEYFCRSKNGEMILLNTYSDVVEHKINPITFDRIRNICLNK